MGSKRQPVYRIVVADKESPRDGRFIEIIGMYNPRTQPSTIKVEEEKALKWMKVGAQPSDSVQQLFRQTGTTARYERLMKGEALETLVAEATAQQSAAPAQDPRTRVGRVAGSKAA
jgi:small subunit ribosomal protein S16